MSSPATQPLLQPVLEIENLTVSYRVGRRWLPALRDFHLSIRQGEIHGLVGESGSGKSTVASAIMRDLPPNGRISPESSIRFMGEALTQKSRRQMLPIWASRLKLVPQNPGAALNPAIRVGEQVAEVGRRALGLNASDARRRAIEMLQRVRLSDPENVYTRYPHQLSGGMQQRVLIAMALLPAPQLLVLDEPTTGLDVTTEAVMLELIRELMADTDAGALYVTHDLGVVAQLCDAVTVLYAGEIMAEGGVEAMFRQPLHPYTIGLLNSIPRPGQTKYNSRLQAIEGHPPSLRELPSGCVYAPRCPAAIPICQQKPPLEALPGQRLVRCHRWQEIAAGSLRLDQPDTASGDLIPSPPPDRDYVLQVRQLLKHFPVPRSIPDLLRGRKPPLSVP